MTRFPQTHNRWFGPVTQSRMKHSPQFFIGFAQALHSLRTNFHFGINFHKLAPGAISVLHSPRTNFHVLRPSFSQARSPGRFGTATHSAVEGLSALQRTLPSAGPRYTTYGRRGCLSEPPFFTRAAQLQAESARLTRAGWSASSVERRVCSGPTRSGQPA